MFVKCFLSLMLILPIKLQVGEDLDEENKLITKATEIDHLFVYKFLAVFLRSLLDRNNEERLKLKFFTSQKRKFQCITPNIYRDWDVIIDGILASAVSNTKYTMREYYSLANNIKYFNIISTINNKIKEFLSKSDKNPPIPSGSFTNFFVKFFDISKFWYDRFEIYPQMYCIKKNNIINILGDFKRIYDDISLIKMKRYYKKSDIEDLCMKYTHIADFYLNVLKIKMIHTFNMEVLLNEFKIDFYIFEKDIKELVSYDFLCCRNFEVAMDLHDYIMCYTNIKEEKNFFLKNFKYDFREDLISYNFTIFNEFINFYFETRMDNFFEYTNCLKSILIDKLIKNYDDINHNHENTTWKRLYDNIVTPEFKKKHSICLMSMKNSDFITILVRNFVEKIKMINKKKELTERERIPILILARFLICFEYNSKNDDGFFNLSE